MVRLSWLSIVLVAFGGRAADGQDAPITQDNLIANWKQLDEWDRSARTYEVGITSPQKPSDSLRENRVKIRTDRWLYWSSYKSAESLFSTSPKYQFLLWRDKTQSGWTLREFLPDSESPEATRIQESLPLKKIRPLGTVIIGTDKDVSEPSLYRISQTPSFRVTKIVAEPGGLDRVFFEYQDATANLLTDRKRSSFPLSGNVRGAANRPKMRPWVYELVSHELYPEDSAGGAPRCRRLEYTIRPAPTSPIDQHDVLTFSNYRDESTSDEEFSLAHYGLPEPVGAQPKKLVPNYVWFLLAAALFAFLAVGIRYYARRRNSIS